MKITDVRVHVVAPMGADELAPGARLGWAFVEIETDEGLTGVGECSNWVAKGNVIVAQTVRTIADALRGEDPTHIERLWHDTFRQYTYLGNRGLISTVVSGIDIALWDLKGKALGRPVYDLLGGPVRDAVPLYTHPGPGTPAETAQRTRELLDEGFEAFKFDPFWGEPGPRLTAYTSGSISRRGLNQGAAIMEAVRAESGPDAELLIDLRGNYNVASAIDCIQALEPYGITWFEEPVPPEGIDALRQIRSRTDAALCVGERLYTRWDFLPVLSAGLANYVMPDICWTGGISELRRIAALAETYFVPISPHNAMGPIQVVASAHVMRATPNCYRQEINSRWAHLYNACITTDLDIRGGMLFVPEGPGLGVELDLDFIRAHPDPDWPAQS